MAPSKNPMPKRNLSTAWKCNNDIITSWILNSVSKEMVASIVHSRSAKLIWYELKNRFKQRNKPHVYQLHKKNTNPSTFSIETYYTKLKIVWKNICDYKPIHVCFCGDIKKILEHFDLEFFMIHLMGLNEAYASIIGHILLMNPIPSITKVL